MVDEVQHLLRRGYSFSLPSLSGIGYRQMGQFLQGEMTLSQATDRMKVETHRLARHQYAWFRLGDKRIAWLDAGDEAEVSKANTVRHMIESFASRPSTD